jgi:hypothetical protein
MEEEKQEVIVTDIKKLDETPPPDFIDPAQQAKAEMEAKAARAKELLDSATAICKSIQEEFPMISFVFAASPAPGQVLTSRGGADIIQLGILQLLTAMTSMPMVHDIMQQNQPRIINPHAPAVIPLRPNARR